MGAYRAIGDKGFRTRNAKLGGASCATPMSVQPCAFFTGQFSTFVFLLELL